MTTRAERFKHRGVVAVIDIFNTDQTQRDFGRKAADELPLRVASRLLSTIRDIDSAARLSPTRFGLLVEGPVNADDIGKLGQLIIARCLMPFSGLHENCVARVRVAYLFVPDPEADIRTWVSSLEDRLSRAGNSDDKRTIFNLSPNSAYL